MNRRETRLLGSSALFLSGRVTGAAATFVVQVLLARWLGAEGLGQYVQAFAACVLLTNLSLLGLGSASMRFLGEALASEQPGTLRGFVRRARQVVLVTAVGILGVGWLVTSPDGGSWFTTWRAALLCVPLYALMRLHGCLAHGMSWLPLTVLPNSFLRPLLLLGFVSVSLHLGLGVDPAGVLAVHAVLIAALALVQGVAFQKRLDAHVPRAAPRYATSRWLGTAAPLSLTALFTAFYPELNVVIAGTWLTDSELGALHAAYRTALLIAFGLTAVDAAALPRLSRWWAGGDRDAVQVLLARAARWKVFGGLAGLLLLTWSGPRLLAFFDPSFASAYGALLILAAAQVARGALGPSSELLGISGHQKSCLIVHGAGLIATVLLLAVLTPVWGVAGVAAAVLLVTAGTSLWLRVLVVRRLGVEPAFGLASPTTAPGLRAQRVAA